MLSLNRLSQYEARLKLWGYRKNINKSDWIKVAKVIQERAIQGKQSVVFVSGEPLEDSQVRKGMSRPAVRDAIRDNIRESPPIHHLPSYVEVLTPKLGPRGDDQEAEGTSKAPEDSPYLRVGHDLDLNSSDEISNTVSQMMPDIETELVRFASPSEVYFLDFYKSGFCASPISAGDSEDWIKTVAKEKLIAQVEDTFSLLAKFQGKIESSSHFPNSMTETYQRMIRNILPVCYSYNLESKTQNEAILQIAIYQLVNGNIKDREDVQALRSADYNKRPTVAHQKLDYSKPILWALSYFQRGSIRLLQRLRNVLPSPYLEAFYRTLFAIALKADAYEVLEGLLSISKTLLDSTFLSRMNTRDSVFRTNPLERIFAHGPLSLARLIIYHTSRSIFPVSSGTHVGDLNPVEKIHLMISEGITPNWTHILRRLVWSRNTTKMRHVMEEFTHWRTDLDSLDTSNLITDLIRYISEADAVPIIEIILKEIQPATLDGLKNCRTIPILVNGMTTPELLNRMPYTYDILSVAVARKYDAAIDLLMSAGFQGRGFCLCEAIWEGRMDLIERLLNCGSSPWDLVSQDPTTQSYFQRSSHPSAHIIQTTPYAEAIRMKNDVALRLFDKQSFPGPHRSLTDERVSISIQAASEVGNEAILSRFLQLQFTDPQSMLTSHGRPSCLKEAAKLAAKNNHTNILALLLKAGAEPSASLFEYAVASKDEDLIIQLFECDIENLRHSNMRYHGAILAAIDRGDQRLLSTVLDCVDLRYVGCAGDFLLRAVNQNDLMLVKNLIHRGVSPNARLSGNKSLKWGDMRKPLETPLIMAIRKRYNDITTFLLDNKASMNPFGHDTSHQNPLNPQPRNRYVSALEQAAAMHDTRLIRELLRRGAEPYDSIAILLLDNVGDRTSLDMLLDCNLALPRRFKTSKLLDALTTAVRSGNADLLHRLLPHVDTETMFSEERERKGKDDWKASSAGSRSDEQTARLNILSFAMYSHARKHCSIEMFRSIMDFGSDPEAICMKVTETRFSSSSPVTKERSFTPIQNAILLDLKPCIHMLIDSGANINREATNVNDRTALQLAVEIENAEMVSYLISKGAQVNALPAPRGGFTALQIAAKHGLDRIAELLIDAKADVDAPGAKIGGRTAFEAATEAGRLDMMGLLVKNGALNINGEKQYERAVKLAMAQGQNPAVEYAGQLRAKLLEATRAAEREYQELLEYPMLGFDT